MRMFHWLRAIVPALVLAAPLTAAAQGELVVYCTPQEEWCRPMVTAFEKATGIKVLMTRKSSGEFYAQIKAEAANPRGDILWGGTGLEYARDQRNVIGGAAPRRPAALDSRRRHLRDRAYRETLAVAPRAFANGRRIQPIVAWIVDRAQRGYTLLEIADRNTVARQSARVVGGAVDRIDQPQVIAGAAALLLADDRVARKARSDRGANKALDLAVHRRDDVVAALHRRRRCAEGAMRELARVARHGAAEIVAVHEIPAVLSVGYLTSAS